MKNSINKVAQTEEAPDLCNEQACATCFQNRGCIYEQPGVAIRTTQETQPELEDIGEQRA